MFGRLRKHRTYQYTPRFYKPEEEERRRPPLRIRRSSRTAQQRSILYLIITIGFVLYIFYMLSQLAK
ncbi:MAG: hypothetical protein D6748_06735 [Calditrichaeota bacterium]|nr:MAG: hypothetical protein D6748_06735 [Calditrichota bacterium]